jgi:hypothetical protein
LGGDPRVSSSLTFGTIKTAETMVNNAELCSGSTEDFESFCPGSNPGSAAS